MSENNYKQDLQPATPALIGSILLAQHIENIPSNIIHHIESTGAKVTLVPNGQQVFEHTLANEFDLILMDIHMPLLNGLDTLKGLKQLGYGKPVYALSNQATPIELEEYSQQGFEGTLVYPINPAKLYTILQRHLSSSQQTTLTTDALTDRLQAKIAELKPIFIATLNTQYQQLNEHIEQRDYAQIIKILHVVKGSAGNFGFNTLTDVANTALISLRLEHFDEAPALIAKAMNCIAKTLKEEEKCEPQN